MSTTAVVVLLVVVLLVGLFIGAATRGVFDVIWGAWLLFWDDAAYAVRRVVQTAGVLALLALGGALIWYIAAK